MKRNTDRQGFSLLEVLVAMVLFAIGIMAVFKLFPLSIRQAQGAAERTVASQLADTKFGALRAQGDKTVGRRVFRYGTDFASDFTISSIDQIGDIYGIYEGYATNIQRAASGEAGLHRVVFNVKMYDGRYERFVTYLANQ